MRIGINASFVRKIDTGIGQVTFNFIKQLARDLEFKDHEVVLYLEDNLNLYLPNNFQKKVFLPAWKRDDLIRKIWWEKFLLPREVKRDKCDVLLSLYQSATIVSDNLKHVMVVHDIIPELFPEYLNNFRKKLYWKIVKDSIQKADKIISVSKYTEKDLINHLHVSAKKITVNHVDVDEIYKKIVSEEGATRILRKYGLKKGYIYYGGGLDLRKNVENVLRSYKILREKNKKEHFIKDIPLLAISGKLRPEMFPLITDAENIAKKLNIFSYIKFLGFVPQSDLPAIYQNAGMFLYPSSYEGFGLPVLEAMNSGLPTITSKVSSLPEIGRDGVLYCNHRDPSEIAMVMRNILSNRHLRENLSQRGKERAKNFSWINFTKKVLHVIENNPVWKN